LVDSLTAHQLDIKSKMKEYLQDKGIKNVAVLSSISGVPPQTLTDWYISRRFVFDAVVEKAVRDTTA
jgi:hypothetical protein